MLARIGGTEFALIVHTSGLSAQVSAVEQDKCQQMAKELITACIQPFYIESGHRCEVGLNIGAAAFPSDADNAEDLMKYADLAVFAAKKQLKGLVRLSNVFTASFAFVFLDNKKTSYAFRKAIVL